MEVTILMPCLNEENTVEICINKSLNFLNKNNINGEILIVDNGSKDKSIEKIKATKARLIKEEFKGYGSALITGIKNAKGKYVIIGDSDDSYDFNNLMPFIIKLRENNDLVIGNRFKGGIEKGAMPFLHKLGVPFLTFLGNIIYKTKLGDYHCGLRGFNKEKILNLNLECLGMDFASELIIKSKKANYKIVEIPIILKKDGRERKSHLRTFKDGMLHVKCLLRYRK